MQPSGWSTPWFRHRGVSLRLDARVQGGGPSLRSPEIPRWSKTVFGQLDGQVFEWFQTFFRWAKYCLALLSSSRLPTLRRVQHLISVFNNIDFRLQNGPMCESTLLFRVLFQDRFHGFVFWTFKGADVEHWIFAAAARGGLEGRGGVDLNGIQWEFMDSR